MRRALALAAGLLALLIARPAQAEVTITDLQIAARALSFMQHPLSGTVRLGIVYVPGDEASGRAADAVMKLLGVGLKAGNLVFIPVRIAIGDADKAPVDLFFLPEGLGNRADLVAAAEQKRKLTCITIDIAQVERGTCVVGVQSQPKVRIYISSAAAIAGNVSFVTVFLMMATEV